MILDKPDNDPGERLEWLEMVRRHIESLRYGTVQIVVHDSRVTQIETTQRVRFNGPGNVVPTLTRKLEANLKTNQTPAGPPEAD